MYIDCKFKHCLSYGSFEIEDSKVAWFNKKGFNIPTTCDRCKSWRDSITRDESVRCSSCYSNSRDYTTKQIIGAQMLGDKPWDEVRSSYVCTSCYHEQKRTAERKHQIKCSFVHCLSDRGIFEMGQGQVDSFHKKGLTLPTSCKPCRDWKNSVRSESLSCKDCRNTTQFEDHRIIAQNKKSDISWDSFKKQYKCKSCFNNEGSVSIICSNNNCQSNHQTGSKKFSLAKKELEFFKSNNLSIPSTCKPCREFKKNFKNQICKCKTCHRPKTLEAHFLLRQSDKFGISVDKWLESYECEACIEQGQGWYPKDNAWITNNGHKYRYKMNPNHVITDKLFASPRFTDEEAHDMHVHFWKLDQGDSEIAAGFSFKQGFIAPTIIHILSEAGLDLEDNFKPFTGRNGTKIKLKGQNNAQGKGFDIGVQKALKILEVWKNQ